MPLYQKGQHKGILIACDHIYSVGRTHMRCVLALVILISLLFIDETISLHAG